MKNKARIYLLATLLLLGLTNITNNIAKADDTVDSQPTEVQDNEVPVTSRQSLGMANELNAAKDFNKSIEILNAFIESKPKNIRAYKLRGDAYYGLRRYDLAGQDYQKAIELRENSDKLKTKTKVISAVVLGADKQEQYQNAPLGNLYADLMYSQKALNNPEYKNSYKQATKYNSHIYLPKPDDSDINKINYPAKYRQDIVPSGVDVYVKDLVNELKKENFSEANYKLESLLGLAPNYYLSHYLAGVVQMGLDNTEGAFIEFRKATQLNPYDFEAWASIGKLYFDEGEKELNKDLLNTSVEAFTKAKELNPNVGVYDFYIGLSYFIENRYNEAINAFDTAIKINPEDYNSLYYRALSFYMIKDYTRTVEETAKLALYNVSNKDSVLYLQSLAYYKLKDYEKALDDVRLIFDQINGEGINYAVNANILNSYLYYMQVRVCADNHLPYKKELEIATKNSLINTMVHNSKFYTSDYRLTYDDFESQYEYAKITFADLGLDFTFVEPGGYKLSKVVIPVNKGTVQPQKNKVQQTQDVKTKEVKPEKVQENNVKEVVPSQKAKEEVKVQPEKTKPAEVKKGTQKEVKAPDKAQSETPVKVETKAPEKVQAETPATVEVKASDKVQAETPVKVETKASEKVQAEIPATVEVKAPEKVQTETPATVEVKASEKVQAETPVKVETKAPEKVQAETPVKVEVKEGTIIKSNKTIIKNNNDGSKIIQTEETTLYISPNVETLKDTTTEVKEIKPKDTQKEVVKEVETTKTEEVQTPSATVNSATEQVPFQEVTVGTIEIDKDKNDNVQVEAKPFWKIFKKDKSEEVKPVTQDNTEEVDKNTAVEVKSESKVNADKKATAQPDKSTDKTKLHLNFLQKQKNEIQEVQTPVQEVKTSTQEVQTSVQEENTSIQENVKKPVIRSLKAEVEEQPVNIDTTIKPVKGTNKKVIKSIIK